MSLSLNASERKALEASAEILERHIAMLDGSKATVAIALTRIDPLLLR